MKKLLLTFLSLLGTIGSLLADSYVMTPDNATTGNSATAYVTSEYTFDFASVEWGINQWNPSTIQVKTNQTNKTAEFYFYNVTALPQDASEVVLTFSALTLKDTAATGWYLTYGSEKINVSNVSVNENSVQGVWTEASKTITFTVPETANATYLAVWQNGKVATGTNKLETSNAIVIEYRSLGDLEPAGLAFETNNVVVDLDEIVPVAFEKSTDADVTFTSSNPDVAVYEDGYVYGLAAGTAVITASCPATDTYAAGTATLSVKVVAAAANIAAFKAYETGSLVNLTLKNAVVIAVASNGNTYIQDATGGICLYQNVPAYEVGDVLNGSVVGTVASFNGLPELSAGDYANVTKTAGEAPVAKEMLIDEITEADYCTLVTLKNAYCDELKASAEITQEGSTGSIVVYTTFMTDFPDYQNFDITGVIGVYKGAPQILPRSAADFVEIQGELHTIITVEAERNVYVGNEVALNATVNSGAELTYESSNEAVATVDANGVVTGVAAGTAVITITAAAYEGYPEATAEVTVTVTEKPVVKYFMFVSEYNGKYYAATSNLMTNGVLAAEQVNVANGADFVYVENIDEVSTDLLWSIDAENGYIMTYDNKYLTFNKANAQLSDTEVGGWELSDGKWVKNDRALIYREGTGFKTYAISNVGTAGYSDVAVVCDYAQASSLALEDATIYGFAQDMEFADGVTYKRAFANNETWKAWYAPFEANVSDFAYAAEFVGGEGDEISFRRVETATLAANTPYIVRVKEAGEVEFKAASDEVVAAQSATVGQGYTLTGIYAPKADMTEAYALANDGNFHRGSATAVLAPYRFFVTVPAEMMGKPIRVLVDGNETTGLEFIVVNGVENGSYYDLQGRKIEKPNTGIYIINGQKTLVK